MISHRMRGYQIIPGKVAKLTVLDWKPRITMGLNLPINFRDNPRHICRREHIESDGGSIIDGQEGLRKVYSNEPKAVGRRETSGGLPLVDTLVSTTSMSCAFDGLQTSEHLTVTICEGPRTLVLSGSTARYRRAICMRCENALRRGVWPGKHELKVS